MTEEKKQWPSRDWPKRAQLSGIGTATQRAVLVAMAIDGNYYGQCSSSRRRLAELTALSERAVKVALVDLVAIGALIMLDPGGGRGRPAKYQICPKGGR